MPEQSVKSEEPPSHQLPPEPAESPVLPTVQTPPAPSDLAPKPVTLTILIEEEYPQLLQALAKMKQEDIILNEEQAALHGPLIARFKDFCQHSYQFIRDCELLQRPKIVAQLATLQINLLTRGNSLWLDTFLSLPIVFDYGLNDLPKADDRFFNFEQSQVLNNVRLASIFDLNLEMLISTAILSSQVHNISAYLEKQVEKPKKQLMLRAHPDKYPQAQDVVRGSPWHERLPQCPIDDRRRQTTSNTQTLYDKWSLSFSNQYQNVEDKAKTIANLRYCRLPLCYVHPAHQTHWQQANANAYAYGQHIKNQIQFSQYRILFRFPSGPMARAAWTRITYSRISGKKSLC